MDVCRVVRGQSLTPAEIGTSLVFFESRGLQTAVCTLHNSHRSRVLCALLQRIKVGDFASTLLYRHTHSRIVVQGYRHAAVLLTLFNNVVRQHCMVSFSWATAATAATLIYCYVRFPAAAAATKATATAITATATAAVCASSGFAHAADARDPRYSCRPSTDHGPIYVFKPFYMFYCIVPATT